MLCEGCSSTKVRQPKLLIMKQDTDAEAELTMTNPWVLM
jgi:hypothetical protein